MATCPFDRFIVLSNQKSSGRHNAARKLQEMVRLFPEVPIVTYETSRGGVAAYTKLLQAHRSELGPRTLLCVAAGDGSINFLVESLLLDGALSSNERQTPLLPLWGGNGNDLASMLNGRIARTSVRMIFDEASVVPISPMQFHMVHADGTEKVRIACVTASFGATAQAARRLNDHRYRQSQLHKVPGGRYLMESMAAWSAIASSTTFVTEQTGMKKRMYEYTFGKGPRMAKWYRMPVRLDDDRFFLHKMEGKLPIITPTILVLSFRRNSSPTRLYKATELVVHDPVWAQFDGEPELIPSDTKIYVQLSNRPFYAYSRLLGAE